MKLTALMAAIVLAVTGLSFANAQTELRFGIEPQPRYQTPCTTDRSVDPADHYCDVIIVGTEALYNGGPSTYADHYRDHQCDGISVHGTGLGEVSGGAIRIYIDDAPPQPGDYTRMGCEIWFHPDRIHQRVGSVGVRIDWYWGNDGQSYAFAIGDPPPSAVRETTPTTTTTVPGAVTPDCVETYCNWELKELACEDVQILAWWNPSIVLAQAYPYKVVTLPAGDLYNGMWLAVDVDIYTCSF